MSSLKRPGVYIEEKSTLSDPITSVKTAIPAFIGYTEDATLLNSATRITSLLEYKEKFGGAPLQQFTLSLTDEYSDGELISRSYSADDPIASIFKLFHSLELYFNNGGGPCYIVSVGDYDAGRIEVGRTEPLEGLIGGIAATEKVDEPTLYVFPDAISLNDQVEYGSVVKDALNMCNKLQDRFTICDVFHNGNPTAITQYRGELGMNYLQYGAAYYPTLLTTLNYFIDKASVITHTHNITGTLPLHNGRTLAEVENDDPLVYKSFEAEIKRKYLNLPASGAIAGVYAKVDANRGVWKAPANVSLNSVSAPSVNVTNEQQAGLNVDASTGKSINVIRSFSGRGVLVWGARTLAGNDNEWRYVPVRRLYITVAESVKKGTEFVVFEPNTANTWVRIKALIQNYLIAIWRAGGLAGSKPEQAFFVRVGLGETMTAQDILEGKLNVEIGMAAVRPAEFIILKFCYKLQESA
ncbi:hypothetical protein DET49_111108 [Salegentibacter sp. 24]|uniref:phage tail sheath family protein n=1 Tax=Salegentibacter sp. 24 TaxID=2183986 RepID=UPI0010611A8F|nr:phage tail sheath subtilisin-like domain-containing protein [Salegentibacter sp. 24]TDN87660.1 hypothetical protein DET49_111108 [Salegentibacter sp. 24]